MPTKKKLLIAATAFLLPLAAGATAISTIVPDPVEASVPLTAATADEYRQTIEAMKPPKRRRPLVVVLGDNRGTEAIDFLVPYGVFKRADVADVFAVGMTAGPLTMRPALTMNAELTTVEFDRQFAGGADYVVVPAMFDHDSPKVLAWIKAQAAKGATIVAICAGAEIVANAGLLKDRRATTHWASVRKMLKADPTIRWVPNRRYVADRGIVSTTGVSAAIPVSIALVEAIAGQARARAVAAEVGVADWGRSHDSGAYRLDGEVATLLVNAAGRWNQDDVAVPVSNGVDEIGLALTADSWSRTYRSRAVTFAGTPKVKTRHGLQLIVDRTRREGIERMLAPIDSERPARQLDRALDEISSAYGRKTARLVAVQLEYDKGLSR